MGHPSKPVYRKYWAKRNTYATRAKEQGVVLVRYVGSRMQVTAPYSEAFILEAHRLGGRWRTRSKVWSFPEPVHKLVILHIKRIFGEGMINKTLEPIIDHGE